MGKSTPSPPPAPDYVGAAQAQGVANKDSAVASASLSNPNIYSPYGNQTVSYAPTGPDGNQQATINQTLTPDAQATVDAQQRVQRAIAGLGEQGIGQAQTILGQPFQYNGPGVQTSFGGYGQAQGSLGDYGSARGSLDLSGIAKMPINAGTTAQTAILSRLNPQIQQNQESTRQRLVNQGLTVGGEAYNNEIRNQANQENDLYTQAALQGLNLDMSANQQGYNQALGQAGLYNQAQGQNFDQGLSRAGLYNQAQGQNYNQSLGAAQFGNTAAQQAYAQQLSQYNQPLNQITALMSGSQIQNPQFQAYTGQNIQAAPIANATNLQGQYAQNLYGQQVSAANAQNSAIGGILGSIPGMFKFG